MWRCYMYVVDRDFGFAPNPFHGQCTLATCKPRIRVRAQAGDWVIGMGGRRLRATGRCVFAMKVNRTMTFDQYWSSTEFRSKRPVRNGSRKMMVGDNIYHHDPINGEWQQEDSHHSNSDGTTNIHNLKNDTKADRILASSHFLYFGRNAPVVPQAILRDIGYRNVRNYRVFSKHQCQTLIEWLQRTYQGQFNQVLGDPFDFELSEQRYYVENNQIQ